jgi:Tfp pilus assembly protein PilE
MQQDQNFYYIIISYGFAFLSLAALSLAVYTSYRKQIKKSKESANEAEA